jgi:hypothetical protein
VVDPRLPRLTVGTGDLVAHVGSDPVHQERHCLRSTGRAPLCIPTRAAKPPPVPVGWVHEK